MIYALTLENYEGHQDSHFEFVPGINALTGDSDNGKSSIIRAIEWVRTNKPLGDAHISDWIMKTSKNNAGGLKPSRTIMPDKQCAVTVEKDGHELQRCRSSKFNGYYVDQAFQSPLEAMGSDLPVEVSNFFNMDEVNVQRQRSIAFLIDSPPPEAARFLNRLVKLTDIDEYTSIAESKRRATNKNLTEKRELLAGLESQLNTYLWVDNLRPIVLQLESFKSSLDALNHKIDDLTSSLAQYNKLMAAAEKLQKVLKPIKQLVAQAENTRVLVREASKKCAGIQSQLQMWEKYQAIWKTKPLVDSARALISKASTIKTEWTTVGSHTETLGIQLKHWRGLVEIQSKAPLVTSAEFTLIRASRMLNNLVEATTNNQQLSQTLRTFQTLQNTHTKLKTEIPVLIASLPKICPICGGALHLEENHAVKS